MLGKVLSVERDAIQVQLDGRTEDKSDLVTVPVNSYQAIDHGYATTIHKNQGATVDRTFVLASGTMDRHLTYVAMTRHRDGAQLYTAQDEFTDRKAGHLVAHGVAPYEHRQGNRVSYFVMLENGNGERSTAWGGDLGRAMDHPEVMEPGAFHDEDDAGDPAAAFEALRDRVEDQAADLGRALTRIRKGVASAFDQLERQGATVDYSAGLGRMTQQLTVVGEHLQAIHQAPVFRQGAKHYARVLERSGEGLVRWAAQKLENRAFDIVRITRNLSGQIERARERGRQDRWLMSVGVSGVALGILFTLFEPAVLPFLAAPRVASIVMCNDSGMELMQYASPASWERVSAADRPIDASSAAITAA